MPNFTSAEPKSIPLPGEFVWSSLRQVVICYLIIDLGTLSGPPENASALFTADMVPFLSWLRDVSVGEVGVRIFTILGLWLTISCMGRMLYGILASVTILLSWYNVVE